MAGIVVMPRQGNTVESCIIVEWLKKEGDLVAVGDVLCSVETDKSTLDVESEQEGTLLKILRNEDDDVPVLDPIAIIGQQGEDISDLLSEAGAETSGSGTAVEESAESSSPNEGTAEARPSGGGEAGGVEGGTSEGRDGAKDTALGGPQGEEGKGVTRGVSPRARNLAAAKGVFVEQLAGSGPQGRVIERDVQAALGSREPATPAAIAAGISSGAAVPVHGSGIGGRITSADLASSPAKESAQFSGTAAASAETGEYEDLPVKSIRKVIAERMQASLAQTAQLTLNSSAPAESLMRWRKIYKNSDTNSGLNGITINDLVLFAVSRVVPQFPEMNAHFLGDKIRRFSDVNIGIAVDTPKGLMVPVIRAANRKSLLEISHEVKLLAEKCQGGSASPEELSGGTITVTNLGAFGIESFTPVLNAPEVAILGVNNIQLKPVLKDDETQFVPHIGLSLTIDHQAVDGAPGARFLKELGAQLSNLEKVAAL